MKCFWLKKRSTRQRWRNEHLSVKFTFSDTIVSSDSIKTLGSVERLSLGPHKGSYETSLTIFKDENFTIPATSEDAFVAPKKIFALAEFKEQNDLELQMRRCWATPRFFTN